MAKLGESGEAGTLVSPSLVLLVRHHLKVVRVPAQAVIAQVVDVLLAGDEAVLVGERDDVDSHSLAVETHASIASTFAITGGRSLPDQTKRGLVIEEKTIIHNKRPRIQLVEDQLTARQKIRHNHFS